MIADININTYFLKITSIILSDLYLIIVEADVHLPADQVSNANPQSEIISSDASSINSGTVVVEPKFEGKTR